MTTITTITTVTVTNTISASSDVVRLKESLNKSSRAAILAYTIEKYGRVISAVPGNISSNLKHYGSSNSKQKQYNCNFDDFDDFDEDFEDFDDFDEDFDNNVILDKYIYRANDRDFILKNMPHGVVSNVAEFIEKAILWCKSDVSTETTAKLPKAKLPKAKLEKFVQSVPIIKKCIAMIEHALSVKSESKLCLCDGTCVIPSVDVLTSYKSALQTTIDAIEKAKQPTVISTVSAATTEKQMLLKHLNEIYTILKKKGNSYNDIHSALDAHFMGSHRLSLTDVATKKVEDVAVTDVATKKVEDVAVTDVATKKVDRIIKYDDFDVAIDAIMTAEPAYHDIPTFWDDECDDL